MKSSKPKQGVAVLDYSNEKVHIINHSFNRHTGIHPRKGNASLEEVLISQLMFTSINSLFGKPKVKKIISGMLWLFLCQLQVTDWILHVQRVNFQSGLSGSWDYLLSSTQIFLFMRSLWTIIFHTTLRDPASLQLIDLIPHHVKYYN